MGFAGAGTRVAAGNKDPGNWATAIAEGARYGFTLLSVVRRSSVMALLLRRLAARVGRVAGRDLAQRSRSQYSRRTSLALWGLCETAIIARSSPRSSAARSRYAVDRGEAHRERDCRAQRPVAVAAAGQG
ncbi:divalent metal cation transporter [Pandoraea morbifera]|uniref:divalent metal cation transporter n=1 Tax=Pandoraea morbifera TaxID=2508300 RepID=UPI001FEA9ECB|nr:divalent metal cation transporter [Pandoraea morbifera]